MTQFIAFNNAVEVNGETVLSFVNSMTLGQDTRRKILLDHGIDPMPGHWYPQQGWLDAFRVLASTVGEMNLFLIGKAIIDNAQFPPIENLQQGLASIDVAYHMNHRLDGKIMFDPATGTLAEGIGHYALQSFDPGERSAVMVCNNPYPSKFDEGIISQVVRRFKPRDSIKQDVTLDATRPSRPGGADSCTYLIKW